LEFIDVGVGIINLQDEVMDLFLEELNDRVALGDYRITLIDLVLPMMNSLISSSDDPIFLGHQSSKLVNLGDLSISLPIVTSRSIDQLTHLVT
jgi:predicted deacylase